MVQGTNALSVQNSFVIYLQDYLRTGANESQQKERLISPPLVIHTFDFVNSSNSLSTTVHRTTVLE